MADAGADIYLILLRPTKVPIAGEAVSHLFQGQVLIESLSWNLHNEEERKSAGERQDAYAKRESLINRQGSNAVRQRHATEDYERATKAADDRYRQALKEGKDPAASWKLNTEARDDALKAYKDKVNDLYDEPKSSKTQEEEARDKEAEEADVNKNFTITFTKRVDIASTQMLNSMKSGDIFPSGTLTIHKRSATVAEGTSLVFNIQKIRLKDYRLQVEVTDTMTEMMEEWTCEFGALAYVYKNPPSNYSHANAGQAAAKILSQGTTRAFTMKNLGSPFS